MSELISSNWEISVEHSLPTEVWKTEDLQAFFDIDQDFLESKIGISERRFLPANVPSMDLALDASRSVLERCNFKADKLDLIIYVTQNPDFILPHSSARLASLLNCADQTAAFDLSLGCSGWVYALQLGVSFANAQNINSILIVTCDTYSPRIEKADKSMMSIFGDAAAATLMIKSDAGRFSIGRAILVLMEPRAII